MSAPTPKGIAKSDLDAALGFTLSEEQWSVVDAPLEPAVVVAGAGSGKTTSMSARIAWLIAKGWVLPDQVLGLTFTTKAAAQLLGATRRSVQALERTGLIAPPAMGGTEMSADADEEALGEPIVHTYNAFAARLLDEHGIRIGREPGATILTDGARHQLAYRVVCRSSLPLGSLGSSPVTLTGDLLALDDQLAELDIDPLALVDHDDALVAALDAIADPQVIARRMRSTAHGRRLLAQLVLEWRAEKHARNVVDFIDQTRLALELVRTFPSIGEALREQYRVVLLDEYQDTSIAQRRLLQAAFGNGHPVTAVGDPCQAIYGWRGASVDNIERFPEHFPVLRDARPSPAPRYTLGSNRRSGPAILAVANDLSASLRDRHTGVPVLEPAAPEKGQGEVRVGLFETSAQEKAWIVEQIAAERARIEAPGSEASWSEIAILASTGRDLAELDAMLRERGIPTQRYGAAGLLNQPVVVDLRAMLEILHNPIANPEVVRILTGPRWRLGVRDLTALGARAAALAASGHRRSTADVGEALDDAVAGADPVEAVSLSDALADPGDPAHYSPEGLARIRAFADEIARLRRHTGEPLVELIGLVASTTGLDVEMALARDPAQQQAAWASFLDLAAEFTDIDGLGTLGAFLSRLRDAERFDVDLQVDLAVRADAVQLLTIHKAKGLEFPQVYVPSVARTAFPGGRPRGEWPTSARAVPWPLRDDSTDPLESFPDLSEGVRDKHHKAYQEVLRDLQQADDQRLAYVAMTRAEHRLVVTGHWWGPTQRTMRGPDPYLSIIHATVDGTVGVEGGGEIVVWHPRPDAEAENPSPEAGPREFAWPVAPQSADRIARDAERVREAMAAPALLPAIPEGLTAAERAQVEAWDLDAGLLLDEARRRRSSTVHVPLPASLSASAVIAALRDPERTALELARPMPQAPSPAAGRGTAFHAWVESRYGQQSLIDPDELPGAGDDDIVSDARLEELKAAFEQSAFAGRTPVAVEAPFAIVVGGRVVRGRIDAVFERNGRYDVIDWKTGSASSADPYQLALYCIAWSQLSGVPLRDIDAGFFLVATGELVRPSDLPDLEALATALGVSG